VKEYIRNKPLRRYEDANMDESENDDFGDVDDLGICEIRIADHNNSLESPMDNH